MDTRDISDNLNYCWCINILNKWHFLNPIQNVGRRKILFRIINITPKNNKIWAKFHLSGSICLFLSTCHSLDSGHLTIDYTSSRQDNKMKLRHDQFQQSNPSLQDHGTNHGRIGVSGDHPFPSSPAHVIQRVHGNIRPYFPVIGIVGGHLHK